MTPSAAVQGRVPSADRDAAGRLHLFVALSGIAIVLLAPLLSWGMALLHVRDTSGPWRRRLFTLALVDTALVAALALASVRGLEPAAPPPGEDEVAAENAAQSSSRSLFAPVDDAETPVVPGGRRLGAAAGIGALGLLAGLTIAGRARRARVLPPLAVGAALVATSAASSLTLAAFRATLGPSFGAMLVAVFVGSVCLLALALAGRRLRGARLDPPSDALTSRSAFARGILYGFGGAARIGIALALLTTIFRVPLRTITDVFAFDLPAHPMGAALFALTSIVIAPIGEETLFRGILLPWLARFMRPAGALFWSALVFATGHLYYGTGAVVLFYYGLVLGWARLATGNLRAPVALHASLNAVATLLLVLGSA